MQFEANLKALAQAHLALLEQGEKYMPQASLPNQICWLLNRWQRKKL